MSNKRLTKIQKFRNTVNIDCSCTLGEIIEQTEYCEARHLVKYTIY